MPDNQEKTLSHFGIKGMRWGRTKVSSISPSNKTKIPNESDDHKRKVFLKNKRIETLSNTELKDLTTRLQLEKQYKDLKKNEMSAGQKFVVDILKEVGKEVVKTALKSTLNNAKKAVKKD